MAGEKWSLKPRVKRAPMNQCQKDHSHDPRVNMVNTPPPMLKIMTEHHGEDSMVKDLTKQTGDPDMYTKMNVAELQQQLQERGIRK